MVRCRILWYPTDRMRAAVRRRVMTSCPLNRFEWNFSRDIEAKSSYALCRWWKTGQHRLRPGNGSVTTRSTGHCKVLAIRCRVLQLHVLIVVHLRSRPSFGLLPERVKISALFNNTLVSLYIKRSAHKPDAE